jgi:hypothetical protein
LLTKKTEPRQRFESTFCWQEDEHGDRCAPPLPAEYRGRFCVVTNRVRLNVERGEVLCEKRLWRGGAAALIACCTRRQRRLWPYECDMICFYTNQNAVTQFKKLKQAPDSESPSLRGVRAMHAACAVHGCASSSVPLVPHHTSSLQGLVCYLEFD